MAESGSVAIGGGQIWKQPEIPCFTCYIAYLGNGKMAQMSDPRERGSIAFSREGSDDDLWSPAELQAHLLKLGYVCQGQLKDLILADQGYLQSGVY